MTGYLLFKHAVQRVFRNLDDALAISGLIWIATMAVLILSSAIAPPLLTVDDWSAASPFARWINIGSNMTVIFVSIWIAVEWHRFALLGERPQTILPPLRRSHLVDYFVKSLLILLVLFGVMMAGLMVLMLLTALLGGFGAISFALVFVILVFVVLVFYRISPLLPAAAMGEDMKLATAWGATKPYTAQISQAAILLLMGTFAMQVLGILFGQGLFGLIYSLVTGWIALMVGVSLLSSIYELAASKADR